MINDDSPHPLILVVEDDDDTRESYALSLGLDGYRVELAASSKQALAMMEARVPNLIRMDFSLPGMDGLEVARRLKADPRTRHIPILMVTGHPASGLEMIRP